MTKILNLIGISASPSEKRKDVILLVILPWVILAASLAFTFQMWLQARHDAEQSLQIEFDYRVRDAVDGVSNRMKTYEQVMRGVDGMFAHSEFVEQNEFHGYISRLRLKENYPGIRGIRFVPLVEDANKDKHVAAMRKEGLPSYSIWPKSRRDVYAPVAYSEPLDTRDQRVIGYDMLSDYEYPIPGDSSKGIRRATMERARDSGGIAVSGKLRLLYKSEEENQNDFVMFLPVYRFGASYATTADRRANIIGWVCSVFNVNDLMRGILGDRDREIDIEIFDDYEVSELSKMFDSQPSMPHPDSRFRAIRHLKVADRTWTVAVHSLPSFEEKLDVEKPRIIASTGILISLLLAIFFWMLIHGRKRALRTASRLSLESRKNEMLLRTASDGIHICDLDGNLVQTNDAFCRMLGYTHDEMRSMNIAQLDAQSSEAELKANLSSFDKSNFSFETRHRCRDGKIIDVEINASLVEIDGRKLIYNAARDITERKAAEQQLRDLTAYLQSVREEEKISIAREIHDDLGGMLTTMKIEAYWLKTELSAHDMEATALFEHVQELSRLIDDASAVMRNVITGLRPTILDDLGLLAALEWQAEHFQKLTGIRSRVNCIGNKGNLDKTRSVELFRISQEALSNVAKHSGATSLEIEYHHSDEEVVMSIIDNGRGMSAAHTSASKHYGMLGMRERTDQLGGKISIDTPPGGGFSLTVTLPLPVDSMENT